MNLRQLFYLAIRKPDLISVFCKSDVGDTVMPMWRRESAIITGSLALSNTRGVSGTTERVSLKGPSMPIAQDMMRRAIKFIVASRLAVKIPQVAGLAG